MRTVSSEAGLSRRRSRLPGRAGRRSAGGQATAEFALVIGVLVFIMLGVVDLGRMIAMQSAVVTASREGARYGAAVGQDAAFGSVERYRNCLGIKEAARRVSRALVSPNSITVQWDAGPPGTTIRANCNTDTNPAATTILPFDRVIVTVDASFSPISALRFVIPSVSVTSVDRRTIVKQP